MQKENPTNNDYTKLIRHKKIQPVSDHTQPTTNAQPLDIKIHMPMDLLTEMWNTGVAAEQLLNEDNPPSSRRKLASSEQQKVWDPDEAAEQMLNENNTPSTRRTSESIGDTKKSELRTTEPRLSTAKKSTKKSIKKSIKKSKDTKDIPALSAIPNLEAEATSSFKTITNINNTIKLAPIGDDFTRKLTRKPVSTDSSIPTLSSITTLKPLANMPNMTSMPNITNITKNSTIRMLRK